MPYVILNLGGTSTNGDHYSNYSEFHCVGGSGLDTALTYSDAINQQIAHAIQHSNTTQQTFPRTFLEMAQGHTNTNTERAIGVSNFPKTLLPRC